jgi:uridine kinase
MNLQKPYLIGIAGGSASGKTYLLNALLNHFNADEICLISQDHYYKPQAEQFVDENGQINYDLPEGIDKTKLLADIEQLLHGNTIQKLEYTFNNPAAKPKELTIHPAPIIVIEGLFIFHFQELFKAFDLKIFIDADHDIKLTRRLERDQIERGYSKESILYQWHNHVMPAFDQYLLPYQNQCDVIIHNNDEIKKDIEQLAYQLRMFLSR